MAQSAAPIAGSSWLRLDCAAAPFRRWHKTNAVLLDAITPSRPNRKAGGGTRG
jgi:hypothetical protein